MRSAGKRSAKTLPLPGSLAQARAAHGARAAAVHAVEAFGQAWQVACGNADARVLHAVARAAVGFAFPAHGDRAAVGRVAHGVGQQVRQRGAHGVRPTALRSAGAPSAAARPY
ncbi:hypothetical protein G6F55_013974 [Rhizopus delemar]|nr:hypothetical protein G6F55_013974 [Rhizopus delemar]